MKESFVFLSVFIYLFIVFHVLRELYFKILNSRIENNFQQHTMNDSSLPSIDTSFNSEFSNFDKLKLYGFKQTEK